MEQNETTTQMYLVMTNHGKIELDAFRLMGATDKRDSTTKIGWFGSGLKYAIAYLLRNNHEIIVYSGNKEIKIGTVDKDFRGKIYKVITINGEKTSLTTEMGPDWQAWYAVREIYCNAVDEGKPNVFITNKKGVKPRLGQTTFAIAMTPDMSDIHDNWNKYFSLNRIPIYSDKNCSIFDPVSTKVTLYRRGVRCYDSSYQSGVYDYQFNNLKINESRVADRWDILSLIQKFYSKSASTESITKFLSAINNDKYIEHSVTYMGSEKLSDNWLMALNGYTIVPTEYSGFYDTAENPIYVPVGLYTALQRQFSDKLEFIMSDVTANNPYELVQITEQEKKTFTQVMEFLIEADFKLGYEVQFGKFAQQSPAPFCDFTKRTVIFPQKLLHDRKRLLVQMLRHKLYMKHHLTYDSSSFVSKLMDEFITQLEDRSGLIS